MYLERHGKTIAVALMLLCSAPLTTTVFAMEKDIQPNWVGDKSPAAVSARMIATDNLKKDIKKNIQGLLEEEKAKDEEQAMLEKGKDIQGKEKIGIMKAQDISNTEIISIPKEEEKKVDKVSPTPEKEPEIKVEPKPEIEDKPVPQPVPTPQVPVEAELNARIASEAQKLVGVTNGWQCTEVATQALINSGLSAAVLWPDQYIMYGYFVDLAQAQPGNLIYYSNGGRGIDHIAIYIGNGMAVHGNYNGCTVIAPVYSTGLETPHFIQVAY